MEKFTSREAKAKGVTLRFFWRLHYLVGEMVIQVQEFLVGKGRLEDCLLLKEQHVDKISLHFLTRLERKHHDPEFLQARENMSLMYRHNLYDYKLAASLYSYFNKLAYGTIEFEMMLDFELVERNRDQPVRDSPINSISPASNVNKGVNNRINGTSHQRIPLEMEPAIRMKVPQKVQPLPPPPPNYKLL